MQLSAKRRGMQAWLWTVRFAAVAVVFVNAGLWFYLTRAGWQDLLAPPAQGGRGVGENADDHSVQVSMIVLAALAVALLAAARWPRLAAPFKRGLVNTTRNFAGATLAYFGAICAVLLTPLLIAVSRAHPTAPGGTIADFGRGVLDAATAGTWEEPLLLALPVAAITCGFQRLGPKRLAWAALVAVLLRVGIHLYWDSWNIAVVIPWQIAAVLLLVRFRSIWPFVVAHTLYDIVSTVPQTFPAATYPFVGVLAAGVVAGLAWLVADRRQNTLNTLTGPLREP